MVKTVEILITGRVQKVGFRACIRRIATDLNVTGTVINLSDGRVQVHATGEPMILEKFISMVYGCPRAVIRDVKLSEIPVKKFDEFSIIKAEGRISTGL
jgi:acylphosphatase